jgi:putative transcriptional regulator
MTGRFMNRLTKQWKNNLPSLAGNLLVAAPGLIGHAWARKVILILEHSDSGAIGVILNSEENEEVHKFCQRLAHLPDKQAALQQFQSLTAKSTNGVEPSEVTVCMAKPVSNLEDVVEQLGENVRVFLGRLTWEAGQLEQELSHGAWMFLPAFPHLMFGHHENLWQTCVKCIGECVIASAPGVKPVGDCSLN